LLLKVIIDVKRETERGDGLVYPAFEEPFPGLLVPFANIE